MNFLLVLAGQATCFSPEAQLIGDAQQLKLRLYLPLSSPLDPLCSTLNGSISSATLNFAEALATGSKTVISNDFTYVSTSENIAEFDLPGFSTADFLALVDIKSVDFTVDIDKANRIFGSINEIQYVQSDVSNCWASLKMNFSLAYQWYEIIVEPNNCVFPVEKVGANVRYKAAESEVYEETPMFAGVWYDGLPQSEFYVQGEVYNHMQVKRFRQACDNYTDAEDQNVCRRFIGQIQEKLNLDIQLVLGYVFSEIESQIIGTVTQQTAVGSTACTDELGLKVNLNFKQILVSSNTFDDSSACANPMSTVVQLQVLIYNSSSQILLEQNYSYRDYADFVVYEFNGDFSEMAKSSAEVFVNLRFVFFVDQKIIKSVSYADPVIRWCYDFLVTKFTKNSVQLSLWKQPDMNCSGNGTVESSMVLYSLKPKIIQIGVATFPLNLNYDENIEIIEINCDQMHFQSGSCSQSMDEMRKQSIGDNTTLVEFSVGEQTIFSRNSYVLDIWAFFGLIAGISMLYVSVGLLFVFIVIHKQRKVD